MTDKKVWIIRGTSRGMGVDFARAALAALSFQLTAEEITRLEEPYRPHPVIAHI